MSYILNDEKLFIFQTLDRKWMNHFSFPLKDMHCIFVQIPISDIQICDTLIEAVACTHVHKHKAQNK